VKIQAEGRLLGLMAVSDEARQQVDEEVVWAAVAGILDLRAVLELIDDGLDEGTLAEKHSPRMA
jgi:hypothetical protein